MNRLVTVLCAMALASGAAACTGDAGYDERANSTVLDDARPSESRDIEGTTGDGTVDVADVVANPQAYFGSTVTIVADVEEVFGPRAFALDEDAPLRGGIDRDLLVFGKSGNLEDIDDQWLNNKVRVTGTVGMMSVVELEREVGWDLDPQIEAELEHAGAVLIASSVDRVDQQRQQR